ncbi:MAG: hypothetical protein MUF06_12280 [Pirellulaceae bacterium]|nr:hypothetical protein [Pirellulaceae bacterium]
MVTRPRELTGLTPLLDAEKDSAGLAGVKAALAYRYLGRPFAATLVVERTRPSITAEVFSFFDIRRENLTAHYELHYDVREARTRRVYFLLPKETPTEISVRGLAGTTVKEFHADDSGAQRRWEVQLADRQQGSVRLAVDFQQSYDPLALQRLGVPLVTAAEVEYQTAFVAIEGNEELEISLTTAARRVDVGELSRAEHPVGRRVIGSFGYIGDQMSVFANVAPRDPYELPAALIQQARLTTRVSAAGRMQSLAEFDLLTKATLVEVRLPPRSTLWTIWLDEQPTKPQRDGDALLLALPAQDELALRTLRLVYETPGAPLGLAGTVAVEGPKLLVRAAGKDDERLVPQADLEWKLYLPSGYVLRRSGGTLTGPVIASEPPAVLKVATLLYEWGDGFRLRDLWGGGPVNYSTYSAPSAAFNDAYGFRADKSEAATAESTPAAGYEMAGQELQWRSARDEAKAATMAPPPQSEPLAETASPPTDAPANEPQAPAAPAPPPPAPVLPSELEINIPPAGIAGPQQSVPNPPGEEDRGRPGRSSTIAALTGVSSLRIDIQGDSSAGAITFTSLGSDPQLEAAVIDGRRVAAAAWGLALLVLLVGVGLTFQSAGRQACYVIAVLLAGSVPVLVTDRLAEVTQVFDYCFYAGCFLAVYFPLAALTIGTWKWLRTRVLARCCRIDPAIERVGAVLLAVVLLGSDSPLSAQEPTAELPASVRILNWRELLPLVEAEAAPVAVPPDAVIVPFDPDKPVRDPAREKLLLPYAKYVELWNRAHPDQKLAAAPPPADYAWAGATYEATLAAADVLVVRGTLEIDLFTDKPVAVPMHLAGGVLVKGTVDGGAARLQIVEPDSAQPNQPLAEKAATQPAAQQPAAQQFPGQPPARLLLWHLSGKGRKTIELTIQLGLERQGGWRIARGQLPVAPATQLTLVAPTAGTEIRQQQVADRPTFETKTDGERVETALGPAGLVDLSWRSKVTEGVVDQSLTAKSVGVFDVRDDSLRLVWEARLEFGRALRDAFSFAVPTGYIVEQVRGENVRGWSVKTVGPEQLVDVTLLKGVQGSETITIELAQRGRVGLGELAEFTAPTVVVIDAPLQQGTLVVRRSPRLELRTLESTGLARADVDAQTTAAEQAADAGDAPVLRVQPYQVFRFVRVPVNLRLSAAPVALATTAQVRAAVRIAERDTTLDAAVEIRPQGAPLFRIELYLPAGFELDRLGPADLEWAITSEAERRKLTVLLPTGQTSPFTLTLFGRIAPTEMPVEAGGVRRIAAPVLEVLGVERQEGELAILPDPDTDVRLEDVANAENLPLQSLGWLGPDQRVLAKAALRYRAAGYGAAIVLTPRTPQVSVRTITNIKVTPRAIEETILLNYQIEQAGVRQFAFLLPERFAKGHLDVKLRQEQIVEPATDAMGAAIPGWVRFRVTLQDFVRDQFAIVVMHDRLLEAAPQTAAIPRVEAARIDQRLVVLENAGRDELDVEPADLVGLEPLSPQLQAWRDLTAILGNRITQAYQVTESAANPSLTFRLRERQVAATAQARIDLATTLLVVDASGAYRGLQQYRVTNATEQFLEVELPAGSRLWTAMVAGQPVKPAKPAAGGAAIPSGHVRIPLIKTSEGEADYPVELKYGGRMVELRSLAEVQFPLIKTVNINVELSKVRLLLPAEFDWSRYFQFGGTMRHVRDERDLAAVDQTYLQRRIEETSKLLTSANPYTRVRAKSNLDQTTILLDDSQSMGGANQSDEGRALYARNTALLAEAEKKIQEQARAAEAEENDNRSKLSSYWMEQGVNRSKNIVSGLASNFADSAAPAAAEEKPAAFNDDWLRQNELGSQLEKAKKELGETVVDGRQNGIQQQAGSKSGGRFFRGGEKSFDMPADDRSGGGQPGQGQPLQFFNPQQRESLELTLQEEEDKQGKGDSSRKQDFDSLSRYGMNLDRNAQLQEGKFAQPAGGQPGMPGGGSGGFGAPSGDFGGQQGGLGMGSGGAIAAPPGGSSGPTGYPELVTGESLESLAAGLASLDFKLPERGEVYLFTVPRGQIEIKAWPVAHELVRRILGGAGLIVAVVLIWLATRPAARRFWRQLVDQPLLAICLGVLGLASMVTGVLPGLGLVLVLLAAGLGVRWLCCIRQAAA